MKKSALSLILLFTATTLCADNRMPEDSFDNFFEYQKQQRDKAKKEREQFLYPKGERFVQNNEIKNAIIATRWFAVAGDPEAQATMGDLFAKGLYEVHDLKSAVYWYDLAAMNGNLYGQYMMGLNYQLGWNGVVDADRAANYFVDANSSDDSPRARRQVAQFFSDRESAMYNFDQAFRWYESAAEGGDVQAMLTLGDLFTNGQRAGKDTLRALKWYGRAAAKNDPYAQYSLGVLYLQGDKVVDPNFNEGLMWISKSAAQNFAAAQAMLGRLYYMGKGVRQNNALAYAWWTLANAEENPSLKADLEQVMKKMSVDEIEQAAKLADYYQVTIAKGQGYALVTETKEAKMGTKGAAYVK